MKCNYCGKRFPTAPLDREMYRNESWGTPYHYAKNEFNNDEVVQNAGFDPEDADSFLCPDCVDKIYDSQKKWASEKYGNSGIIRIKSSKGIFSTLLLNKYEDIVKTIRTKWNTFDPDVATELQELLQKIKSVQDKFKPSPVKLDDSDSDSLVISLPKYKFTVVIRIYPDQLIYSLGKSSGFEQLSSKESKDRLNQMLDGYLKKS